MSGPEPTFSLVRTEEGRHTLTVYYRTEAGEEQITFSRRGEPEGYRLRLVGCSADSSDDTETVSMCIATGKSEGMRIGAPPYVRVTHCLNVVCPEEESIRLTHQLSNFRRSADDVVKGLYKPRVDDLSLSNDSFSITTGYDTLTFGMTSERYRFTFTDFKVSDAPIRGFLYLVVGFIDEDGKEHHVQFAATNDEAIYFHGELGAFVRANPQFGKKVDNFGISEEATTLVKG